MSEGYAPTPARRSHRGFRQVQAHAGAGGNPDEPTHRLATDVTLHYGENGPRTLTAGTLVVVLEQLDGLVRFTYPGCTGEHATASAHRFETLDLEDDLRCPGTGVAFDEQ